MNQKTLSRWIATGVIFFLLGVLGVAITISIVVQGQVTEAEPQTLTCRQLIEQGYGDNAHVLITDFKLLTDSAVVEYRKLSKIWERVWVPMVPNDKPADSKSVQVLLLSREIHNSGELNRLNDQRDMQGVVEAFFTSLGDDQQRLLRDRFPETDFDNCKIVNKVDTGSTQDPLFAGLVCGSISVIFLVIGVLACIFGIRRARKRAA